ncbi:MAG: CDP-alcohol phosphatidyltransferase family protein [bacterium]|nr:CDP-alcohol phosphatidyltransferase family protein [bacterium]
MSLANKITILRIFLIPIFIISLMYSQRNLAIIIFLLSIITDGLDGIVARRFSQRSDLGSFLDPLADKLLLTSSFIVLAIRAEVEPLVAILVVSREVILFLGWVTFYLLTGNLLAVSPTIIGKFTTCLQMTTIILYLLRFFFAYPFCMIMLAFLVFSTLEYLHKGSRKLTQHGMETK